MEGLDQCVEMVEPVIGSMVVSSLILPEHQRSTVYATT